RAPAPGPTQSTDYAGELRDMGVAPKDTLESNVGTPTPMSVPGGQRVTTTDVQRMIASNPNILLIDVLVDPHQSTLQGARYLPAAGKPGDFNDSDQTRTAQGLQALTGGRRDYPMVFFCAGSACWESYNAVLRARAAGYTQLYWYRGGLASWGAAGLSMQQLPQPMN
ncbi:MAG TPA: rhodanese-like domain-containing protein, partial [Terricaulis sp.]|nr:rhodanese-like domain-containing protein [Terricaulis sp.]